MSTISKTELSILVSNEVNETNVVSKKFVDAVFSVIKKSLKSGDIIAINGFGSFTPKTNPSRMGRNPATGEPVQILEKKVVKFKASKDLV